MAAVLALIGLLAPAALQPRTALLRWAVADLGPWLLVAAVGWTVALYWALRVISTLLLRTPGRRLDQALEAKTRA